MKYVGTVVVRGTPAPQGSKRHVGHGVMIESSKKVRPWREAVKFAILDAPFWNKDALAGPIDLSIEFVVKKPTSAPKKRRTYPITRSSGDLDKLLRSTFDGIVDSGLIGDDSQIVELAAGKDYMHELLGNTPGAVIIISLIDDHDEET